MASLLRRSRLGCALLAMVVAGGLLGVISAPAHASAVDISKLSCAYSNESISELNAFGAMVGRPMNCAMVYNDAVTSWQEWEHPWFVNYTNEPNLDWSLWASASGTHRHLIITQDLFPLSLAHSNWLREGAAGRYESYARILARDLVGAGLGDSVIRLAPEANGTWFADSLGATPAQWTLWDRFWDKTVQAMRSVPGANFQFDWCIAVAYRNLPLSQIYPGNRYADIIGFDTYDDGNLGTTGTARWNTLMSVGDGIQTVLDFAKAHQKPISIPEWGVNTTSGGGFGDDPAFVNGIARIVKKNPTAYQSYFYKYGQQTQLAPGTESLAAYRTHFGSGAVSAEARRVSRSRSRAHTHRTSRRWRGET